MQAGRISVLEQQLQDTTEALEDESTHHQADMASIHQKLLHLTSSMQVCIPLLVWIAAVISRSLRISRAPIPHMQRAKQNLVQLANAIQINANCQEQQQMNHG